MTGTPATLSIIAWEKVRKDSTQGRGVREGGTDETRTYVDIRSEESKAEEGRHLWIGGQFHSST